MTVMSDQKEPSAGAKRLLLLLLIPAAVLLAVSLAWFPTASLRANRAATAQQKANIDWLKQKAKESGGDFARLSAEDQRKLTKLYGAMAPNVLKGNANPAPTDD